MTCSSSIDYLAYFFCPRPFSLYASPLSTKSSARASLVFSTVTCRLAQAYFGVIDIFEESGVDVRLSLSAGHVVVDHHFDVVFAG